AHAPRAPALAAPRGRVAGFTARPEPPPAWELEAHAGPDSLPRLLRERPGNVVVLAGRNRDKMASIQAAVEAGLNVLADKPWVIAADELPRLEATLEAAEARGLGAYDIMTQRHENTSIPQTELGHEPEGFGEAAPPTR